LSTPLLREPVRAILLDIEGTTTPLDFVYQVLFPYAKSHVEQFLELHRSADDVREDIAALRQEHRGDTARGLAPPPWREDSGRDVAAYVHWLMTQDRKSTPLKSLQGKIWQEGYERGELRGDVFPDVPIALRRWHTQGRSVAIFSSGSVTAQKLLFAYSVAGDLSSYIDHYFDTTTGSKTEAASYQKIADRLRQSPAEIAFISDVKAELDAARTAGFQTLLSERPGNRPQPPGSHSAIHGFDVVFGSQ
jgi:enolase-phosphatase E1